jgi:hypothetical protein
MYMAFLVLMDKSSMVVQKVLHAYFETLLTSFHVSSEPPCRVPGFEEAFLSDSNRRLSSLLF